MTGFEIQMDVSVKLSCIIEVHTNSKYIIRNYRPFHGRLCPRPRPRSHVASAEVNVRTDASARFSRRKLLTRHTLWLISSAGWPANKEKRPWPRGQATRLPPAYCFLSEKQLADVNPSLNVTSTRRGHSGVGVLWI